MKEIDHSNGYDQLADDFAAIRAGSNIGVAAIRKWAHAFKPGSSILDVGCGSGVPVTKTLLQEGMNVCGVDASPNQVSLFRKNCPDVPVICEPAETSSFFNRTFDGVVAWGLLFLLSEQQQITVIQNVAGRLQSGGRFLFTAPSQNVEWNDVLTGLPSRSLGAKRYKALLNSCGFQRVEEFEDEGENHYYHATKQ